MDCFVASLLAMTVKIIVRPFGYLPRRRRLRARYSLSPPSYRQARAHRFWRAADAAGVSQIDRRL